MTKVSRSFLRHHHMDNNTFYETGVGHFSCLLNHVVLRWAKMSGGTRKCKKCGQEFTVKPTHYTNQRYCDECRAIRGHPHYYCLYCRKELQKTSYTKVRFCCSFCREEYYRLRAKIYDKFSLEQIPIELERLKKEGQDYVILKRWFAYAKTKSSKKEGSRLVWDLRNKIKTHWELQN